MAKNDIIYFSLLKQFVFADGIKAFVGGDSSDKVRAEEGRYEYFPNNESHVIKLYRPRPGANDRTLGRHSSEKSILEFIGEAADLEKELFVFAHEYGHFCCGHTSRESLGAEREFSEEKVAWASAERVLIEKNFESWERFKNMRADRIRGYEEGLLLCRDSHPQ